MEQSFNASNCFALESFQCFPALRVSRVKAAVVYISQNFTAVVKSDDLKSLEFEKIKELLCKDEINVSQEEEVYEAVITVHGLNMCETGLNVKVLALRNFLEEEELITKKPHLFDC